MNSTSQNHDDNEFELQPVEHKKPARHATNAPAEPIDKVSPEEAARQLQAELAQATQRVDSDIPEGPPPSEKVDFENLPEFVWQRKMLRTVRIVAVVVSIIVAIVLFVAFFGAGKGAKDSLKSVIEGEQPAPETKP